MRKIIVFIFLYALLTACGNDKLPKECQEIFDVVKQFNLELDTNPYVSADVAQQYKKYLELTTKGYQKGGPIKGCKAISGILKRKLKTLKEAKSEEEVRKGIL